MGGWEFATIYETVADRAPGATAQRHTLVGCLKTLKAGNTLIAGKLDRLGRSLRVVSDNQYVRGAVVRR